MTDVCVFLGPSRPASDVPPGIDVFPPATLGAIWRAVDVGYRRIGLVDGVFGDQPAVWHKEILFALSRGIAVWGASSMGALRAAEMSGFGMRGVGLVYRLYAAGVLLDDDDVALVHGPEATGWAPLTLPMVDCVQTLRNCVRAGLISRSDALRAALAVKAVHFTERNTAAFAAAVRRAGLDIGEAELRRHSVAQKAIDAARLLDGLRAAVPPSVRPEFPQTRFWTRQFRDAADDLPDLFPVRSG